MKSETASVLKGVLLTLVMFAFLNFTADAGHAPVCEGWSSGIQCPYIETDYIRFHPTQTIPAYEGAFTYSGGKLWFRDSSTNRTVEVQDNKAIAGGYASLNSSGRIPIVQIGDIVRDIRTNSSSVLTNQITLGQSADIKPILSGTQLLWNFVGDSVRGIGFNNASYVRGAVEFIAGSGMTITKNGQAITFTAVGGSGLTCADIVCRIKTNSTSSVWENVTLSTSQYIKPVITVAGSAGIIMWNLIGNFVNSVTVGANTLVGALTLSGGSGISVTNVGNTITITDVNNTSILGSPAVLISKAGNTITISDINNTSIKGSTAVQVLKSGNTITISDINNTSLKGSTAISVSKVGNTITITDINNTSIIQGSGITVSKVGNTITISATGGGGGCTNCEYEYTFWKSTGTAGLANQGLNVPLARTELDSAVLGTRMNITSSMLGGASASCTLHVNVRVVAGTAGQFPRLSIRDVSSQATNVLAILRFSGVTTGTVVQYNTTYTVLPSWLTGAGATGKIVAVYTDTGNGSADYIFKDISLRCRTN